MELEVFKEEFRTLLSEHTESKCTIREFLKVCLDAFEGDDLEYIKWLFIAIKRDGSYHLSKEDAEYIECSMEATIDSWFENIKRLDSIMKDNNS